MTIQSGKALRTYATGLACTAVGAWLTDLTGSLLPLALGSAVLVMATVPLVRVIRRRHAKGRNSS